MTASTTTTARTTTARTTTARTTTARADRLREAAWAGFRVVFGFLFVLHGAVGAFGAFGGVDGAGTPVELLSWPGWWGSAIHLVAGALVLVGLWTRPAALLCSGAMAYAYFVVHQPLGALPLQNGGEPAALFAWAFLAIAAVGSGRYALDALRRR
ncbi:DoxX family protein [Pseudonocardia humida]|uniref:DoxX family protein n=1 Tax=Pseudonocardia humida TaxID=2800819 RepID=A0ABT0ZYD8_9PSEU|nr:DoxX family protein [Pseudonocardia humida]MCO1655664.1 DoxX family protein [Pseudonocardia humida]